MSGLLAMNSFTLDSGSFSHSSEKPVKPLRMAWTSSLNELMLVFKEMTSLLTSLCSAMSLEMDLGILDAMAALGSSPSSSACFSIS